MTLWNTSPGGRSAGRVTPRCRIRLAAVLFRTRLVLLLALPTLLPLVPAAGAGSTLERGLGKPVAEQLEEEIGLVKDPALARWVEAVGSRIVQADGRPPQEYTFRILDADDVNAFAIPGGYIYVTLGLLRFVDSEDELAAVVGHELAHVTAHHGLKQLKRDLLLTLGLSLLRGHVSELTSTLGQLGGVLYSLRHSRGAEAEADAQGIQKVARSGYDPVAMVTFLRKLNEKEKNKPSRLEIYFMTHPPTTERLAKASSHPEVGRRNLAVRRAAGRGLAERGLYRQAIAVYEEVLAREPADAALHLEVARLWEQIGRPDRAREERSRARALGAKLPVLAPAPVPPAPALASRAAVSTALTQVGRAHQRLRDDRDRRVRQAGEVRRDLAQRKREFTRLLRTLDTLASRVAASDAVRAEMLHDIGLAVANVERAMGRIEATAEAGATVTDRLLECGEELTAHLRAGRADLPLVATAESYETATTRGAADLDEGLGQCRQVLKLVDTAIRLCHVAARDMVEGSTLPPPLLLTRFGQIRARIQAAAGAAKAALETAESAGHRADAAEARQRVVALDLLGQRAPAAQRPALFALLARRHGVPAAQAAALAAAGAPLGQAAAELLLGMAVRVPLKTPAPDDPAAAADPRPVTPLPVDEGRERGVPLAPLNICLRLLALDVARECADTAAPTERAGEETAAR